MISSAIIMLLLDRMVELRRTGATTEAIADRLNREGFHPPRGPRQFDRHVVNAFMARQGLLGPRGTRRIARRTSVFTNGG